MQIRKKIPAQKFAKENNDIQVCCVHYAQRTHIIIKC